MADRGKTTPKRAQSANFRRRWRSFRDKAHQFNSQYKADVFVVVRFRGKHYVYTTGTEGSRWPPSMADIVSLCPACQKITDPTERKLPTPGDTYKSQS